MAASAQKKNTKRTAAAAGSTTGKTQKKKNNSEKYSECEKTHKEIWNKFHKEKKYRKKGEYGEKRAGERTARSGMRCFYGWFWQYRYLHF